MNRASSSSLALLEEYLHTLYLIDLYDLQFVGKGVGNFDIMGYPYGHGNDGYIPVNLSPWAKQTIEWQTCTEITTSGTYTIEPSAFADACYKIVLLDWTAWEEYIILENRQQANFDINFWKPGLVMYHIDEGAADQMWAGAPLLGEDYPYNGDHYRVAIIQADGRYDLEMAQNIGDADDVWQPGQILGPNYDNLTFPNTDSYQQGYIEITDISIEVLEPEGQNVRVKVTIPESNGDAAPPPERPAFSAPQKEISNSLAEDQFKVPDDPNNRISGMIPQLPWFESWRQENLRESTTTFTSEALANATVNRSSSTRWQPYQFDVAVAVPLITFFAGTALF